MSHTHSLTEALANLAQPADERSYWKRPGTDEAPPPRKDGYHVVGRVEHLIRAGIAVAAERVINDSARESTSTLLTQCLKRSSTPQTTEDGDCTYDRYDSDQFRDQLATHLKEQVCTALADADLGDRYFEAALFDQIDFEAIARRREEFFQRIWRQKGGDRINKAVKLTQARSDTTFTAGSSPQGQSVSMFYAEQNSPIRFQAAVVCATEDQQQAVVEDLQEPLSSGDRTHTESLSAVSTNLDDDTAAPLAIITTNELDPAIELETDAHLLLPHPLVVGQSPSGSNYPFVPWHGVLTCTCRDKVDLPWKYPLCKHEIAALILENQCTHGFKQAVSGPIAPNRLIRLVHPEAIHRFQKLV